MIGHQRERQLVALLPLALFSPLPSSSHSVEASEVSTGRDTWLARRYLQSLLPLDSRAQIIAADLTDLNDDDASLALNPDRMYNHNRGKSGSSDPAR